MIKCFRFNSNNVIKYSSFQLQVFIQTLYINYNHCIVYKFFLYGVVKWDGCEVLPALWLLAGCEVQSLLTTNTTAPAPHLPVTLLRSRRLSTLWNLGSSWIRCMFPDFIRHIGQKVKKLLNRFYDNNFVQLCEQPLKSRVITVLKLLKDLK